MKEKEKGNFEQNAMVKVKTEAQAKAKAKAKTNTISILKQLYLFCQDKKSPLRMNPLI